MVAVIPHRRVFGPLHFPLWVEVRTCWILTSVNLPFSDSIFYYVTRLEISDRVSGMVYFVQSLIGCLVYFVSLATIGFLATYLFLLKVGLSDTHF